MVLDALGHPFLRFGWLLLIVGCAVGLLALLSLGVISTRILLCALFLAGLVVRCYFSVVENTLTGWGEEVWQSDGFRMEGLWENVMAVIGVAIISWLPTFAAGWALSENPVAQQIAVNAAAALGCEYFCMAILALVVFQNFSQTLPHRVLPAIFRCGASYMFAGLGLMLVPWSFQMVFDSFREDGGLPRWIAASAIAAFFLIAHARLIGLIYMANRERLEWD